MFTLSPRHHFLHFITSLLQILVLSCFHGGLEHFTVRTDSEQEPMMSPFKTFNAATDEATMWTTPHSIENISVWIELIRLTFDVKLKNEQL